MANQIRLKRGSGSDPSASDLAVGEIAIRTDNGKLFTKRDNGSVTEITGGGGIDDGDKGDITVSNSGATFTIDDGVITSSKIANGAISSDQIANGGIGTNDIALTAIDATLISAGSISNAKVASNAAIQGSKIDPDFGSQNIISTGTLAIGNQTITSTAPSITFTDSNNNPDYQIKAELGAFAIRDQTSGVNRLTVASDGQVSTEQKLNCNGGLDTDGDVKFNSGTTNANILFDASDMALEFDDNVKATFGFDQDLQIFHDASDSIINDNGTGNLKLQLGGSTKAEVVSGGFTVSGTCTATAFSGPLTGNVTGNASGSSGSCTGNAATATALANARTIAGVSFDGTSNISLNNNAITNGAGYITGSGNAATATKLATARTIAGVSFDGSANISLNNNSITNGAGYITSADGGNAATLDGIDSSQFLRSDSSDTMSANLTINGRLDVGNGSGSDTEIRIFKADNNVSDHIQFYNGSTRVGEIGTEDSTWLRINQETNKNIYTPRYIRADNGFFVDGTSKGINGSGNFIGGTIAGASDYGTLLRSNANDTASGIITLSSSSNDCLNFSATGNIDNRGIAFNNRTALSADSGDGYLRLNNQSEFSNGVYTPLVMRADGGFNVDGVTVINGSAQLIASRLTGALPAIDGSNLTGISSGLSTGGGTLTGTLNARAIVPTANNTYALGTASARWSDVFTADFHLSNKGSSNQVDNTWGDFTIQEGKDDLFLLNNRNGKMYKFMLKEVS